MDHPDWYPDWRHEAVHQLQQKNDRMSAEFRLGDWPRYDYDMDSGHLMFSEDGTTRVIADMQVVGTTSLKAGNWLWAWANSYWPEAMISDSLLAREFGEKHGICDLTHENVEDDDLGALGWELTAAAARICDAQGAYRPPRDEGGGLFILYRNMCWAN